MPIKVYGANVRSFRNKPLQDNVSIVSEKKSNSRQSNGTSRESTPATNNSVQHSQKSTASIHSVRDAEKSLFGTPVKSNNNYSPATPISNENNCSTPTTTLIGNHKEAGVNDEVCSEIPNKWTSGPEVFEFEDNVDNSDTEKADDNIKESIKRNASLVSLQSRTESIKTQIDDSSPTPLSPTHSTKSLVIEEIIENETEHIKPVDQQIEYKNDILSDDELHDENRCNNTPNKQKKQQRSQCSSPTIEELKILSRRNSMIKSMESVYDHSQLKQNSFDNFLDSSSTSSTQLNASTVLIKTNIPLKVKSKTSHLLKRTTRRVSPVKQSMKISKPEIYPQSLQKFDRPREALLRTFDQMDSSNWEVIILGLKSLVRLMRYHTDYLETQIHMVCIQLTRSVRNLRSQVARAACQASTELFSFKSKYLEQECDDLVYALLHRTADTNRFIRADATRALESMCDNLTSQKILCIVTTKGIQHQNAVVRTTTAKLLNRLVERLGYEKVYQLPKEQRDKFFLTGANLLLEGSLETRSYAKSLFRILSDHPNYNRLLLEVIPLRTYRNIEKTLKNISR